MRGKGWAGKGARNKVGEGAGEDWQRVGERSQLAQALAKPLSAPPARAPSDLITPQKCVLICMRKRPQLPNGAGLGWGAKGARNKVGREQGRTGRGWKKRFQLVRALAFLCAPRARPLRLDHAPKMRAELHAQASSAS